MFYEIGPSIDKIDMISYLFAWQAHLPCFGSVVVTGCHWHSAYQAQKCNFILWSSRTFLKSEKNCGRYDPKPRLIDSWFAFKNFTLYGKNYVLKVTQKH